MRMRGSDWHAEREVAAADDGAELAPTVDDAHVEQFVQAIGLVTGSNPVPAVHATDTFGLVELNRVRTP